MKKIIFLLLLLVTIISSTSAQTKKININNKGVKVKYQSLPKRDYPLFFYYTKMVTASPSTQRVLDAGYIWDKIKIPHQRHAEDYDNAPSRINIDLHFGDISILGSNVISKKNEVEVDGEVVVSYSYFMEVEYNLPVALTETDLKLSYKHTDTIVSKKTKFKYTSDVFPTRRHLLRYFDKERPFIYSKMAAEVASEAIYKANLKLRELYCFSETSKRDILKTMNEKKHLENKTMQDKVDELHWLLQTMTYEKGLEKGQLQHLIDYFEDIPKRFTDPDLKADKQIRYMAYFNLAKIHLYLDDPANALIYADALEANGHDTKAAKNLRKEAENLKEVLISIPSRHFDPYKLFDKRYHP